MSDEIPEEEPTPNNNRRNIIALVVGASFLLIGGVGYLFYASARVDSDLADRESRAQEAIERFESGVPTSTPVPRPTVPPTPVPDLGPAGPVPQPGEVLVVNRVPGDDYGHLAIRHVDGTRTLLHRECLRVHAAAGNGLCLRADGTFVGQYHATFFDATSPHLVELKSYAMALPSRARISPDGTRSSMTAFVSGASYEDVSGAASTLLTFDSFGVRNGLHGITDFETLSEDAKYTSAARQFWGVTFADNDEFYVTGFYGEEPEVMKGSLDNRTLRPTSFEGSCPSLSPDGKTLVYKRTRDSGGFDLVAVDLASDTTWILGETRSVDDQVEWLDDDTILYALHPEGGDTPIQPEFDIWMLDIAEGSEPILFLPNADSPAVIR